MNKKETYFNYNLKNLFITTTITAIIITIIFNLNINPYLKYFIIPITLILSNYLINIKINNLITNKKNLILLIPILLIILNSFIFSVDPNNRFLNIIILPTLIIYFIFNIIYNNKYFLSKKYFLFLEDIPSKLFSNLSDIKLLYKEKNNTKTIINILIGLIIGIPICIFLISILGDADSYFKYFIDNIKDYLSFINIYNIIDNIFIFIILFVLIFSTFINFIEKRQEEKINNKIINISSTIISTILILINFVFLLFLITEISKLTTNFLHIPIEYTYSEYAREGFFHLLFISSINFILTIFIIYKTNLKNNKLIKYLLITLITFSILLIFNSYYRMILYIIAYTFTVLRLQVILFLLLELILFCLLLKKIINNINYNDPKLFSILILIFYIINLYLCNNTIINLINNLFK